MPLAVQVPDEYGFVLAAATSTFFVNSFHVLRTSGWRKKSGVQYPNAYATHEQAAANPAAHTFNCAQRAHANFTENLTPVLGALFISGLQFPRVAAALGGTWALGRVIYLYGYTSSAGPKGRETGATLSLLCDITLKFMAAYTSFLLFTGW